MTRYGGAGPRRLGRWSGEQIAEIADATQGASKADGEQILDSLPAPLQPPATSSGSSGPSDSLDFSAFSSDGHIGRLGYSSRRPSDHARGDSPTEIDSCRTVRTVVPPVGWRFIGRGCAHGRPLGGDRAGGPQRPPAF